MKKLFYILIPIIILSASVFLFRFLPLDKGGLGGVDNSAQAAALREGLVGYWTMDTNDTNGTIIYDRSGKNNHGTLTGTTKVAGKIKDAIDFNGTTDVIKMPSATNYSFANGGTFATWIRIDDQTAAKIIAGTNNASTIGWALYIRSGNAFEIIQYCDGASNGRLMSGNIAGKSGWHHLVVSRTSRTDTPIFYLDSVVLGTSANAACGGSPEDGTAFWLGDTFDYDAGTNPLDDVRFYNRVLSATEVAQLYNSAKSNFATTPSRSASSTGASSVRGLVGYWTMDANDINGTTMYDKSGRNNNAVLVSGPIPTITTGKIKQALNFGTGGTGAAVASSTVNLPIGAAPRSMFGWIKGTNFGRQGLFGYGSAGASQVFDLSTSVDGTGKLYFIGYSNDLDGNKVITDGQWHFVGVTYDGTTVKTYVDGVLDNQANKTLNTGTTYPMRIGSQTYPDDLDYRYFTGFIDDVRIYNYALTTQEVVNLYNSSARDYSVTAPRTGLVGYWTMDTNDMSATGATLYDKSGRGNNGTVTGTTTSTGRINQARSFNANTDNVNLGIPSIFNFTATTPFTFSAWASYRGSGGRTIFSRNNGGYGRFIFAYNSWILSDAATSVWQSIPTSIVSSYNTWHLLTWVYDGSSNVSGTRVYCDGVFCTQGSDTALSGVLYNAATAVYIAYKNDASDTFNGLLDDIRLYGRALSAQEVMNLYQSSARNYFK